MPRIKVDPDQLRATAQSFWRAVDRLDQIQASIRNDAYNLGSDRFSSRYRGLIESRIRNITSQARRAELQTRQLATNLEESAARFERADRQGVGTTPRLIPDFPWQLPPGTLPIGIGAGGALWEAGLVAGGDQTNNLNWIATDDVLKDADHILGMGHYFLKKISYTKYRAFGRSINANWAHNLKGGWVGRMDKAGHIIKGSC